MSTLNVSRWMREFHAEHGIWPIAGGSGEAAPTPPANDTITIPAGTPDTPATAQPPTGGEQPPATPAPTHQVDPSAFGRGAAEAPGAQPAPSTSTTNPATGRLFTEAEVEKIRQEEKDKLYGRVDSLAEELRREREAREAEAKAREEEEARRAAEAQQAGENDLDVRELLRQKEAEWTQRFNEIEAQREADRALLEKERQFNALQEYTRDLLAQHEDDIMPELRDLVTGNTEEEVQASVNRAIEKTKGILGNIQAVQQQHLQQTPTARVTQPGAGGPMEQVEGGQRQLSAQDIRDMSMADFARDRKALMEAAARQYRNR